MIVWHPLWEWILQVTGNASGGTRWNLAWAGFLSAGVISTGIFTHTFHKIRADNCHEGGVWPHGCKRFASHDYEKDGVKYRLCHRCDPRVDHKNMPKRHHFADHHRAKTTSRA